MLEILVIVFIMSIGIPIMLFDIFSLISVCWYQYLKYLMMNSELPKEYWRDFT